MNPCRISQRPPSKSVVFRWLKKSMACSHRFWQRVPVLQETLNTSAFPYRRCAATLCPGLALQPLNTAASAQNACMPRSVSGWSATPARMAAGTVRMSAPASSISDTCAGLRMLAASTSLRMS